MRPAGERPGRFATMAARMGLLLLLAAFLALLAIDLGARPVRAQSAVNRAGLVVRYGDGTVDSRCVEFAEPEISGYELLRRAGLSLIVAQVAGQGLAVCKIGPDGCDVGSCLTCQQPKYWSYWHLVDGTWRYATTGAASYAVRPGAVEGWAWPGNVAPPATTFASICPLPASAASPTAEPTQGGVLVGPTPLPLVTPLPATETPTETPAPVAATREVDLVGLAASPTATEPAASPTSAPPSPTLGPGPTTVPASSPATEPAPTLVAPSPTSEPPPTIAASTASPPSPAPPTLPVPTVATPMTEDPPRASPDRSADGSPTVDVSGSSSTPPVPGPPQSAGTPPTPPPGPTSSGPASAGSTTGQVVVAPLATATSTDPDRTAGSLATATPPATATATSAVPPAGAAPANPEVLVGAGGLDLGHAAFGAVALGLVGLLVLGGPKVR